MYPKATKAMRGLFDLFTFRYSLLFNPDLFMLVFYPDFLLLRSVLWLAFIFMTHLLTFYS